MMFVCLFLSHQLPIGWDLQYRPAKHFLHKLLANLSNSTHANQGLPLILIAFLKFSRACK